MGRKDEYKFNLLRKGCDKLNKYILDASFVCIYVGNDKSVEKGIITNPFTFGGEKYDYELGEMVYNPYEISLFGQSILAMSDTPQDKDIKVRPSKSEIIEFFNDFMIIPKDSITTITQILKTY